MVSIIGKVKLFFSEDDDGMIFFCVVNFGVGMNCLIGCRFVVIVMKV